MKRYEPAPGFSIPCAAMGCMRIADMDVRSLEALIMTALEGEMRLCLLGILSLKKA